MQKTTVYLTKSEREHSKSKDDRGLILFYRQWGYQRIENRNQLNHLNLYINVKMTTYMGVYNATPGTRNAS